MPVSLLGSFNDNYKKNIFDEARKGNIEVLNHKDVSVVKNNFGSTPLHYLARNGKVKASDLKKLFPWYSRKIKGEVTERELIEILNTPQSIQYILEED